MGLMGTDQLSHTKSLITVTAGVKVRDSHAVLKELREHFDPYYDFIMIPKVPLDTLDFTSYRMNLGSKMIIDATKKRSAESIERRAESIERRAEGIERRAEGAQRRVIDLSALRSQLSAIDRRILDYNLIEDTLLLVKVETPLSNQTTDIQHPTSNIGSKMLQMLVALPALSPLRVIALVSPDVDIHDKESYIWGV